MTQREGDNHQPQLAQVIAIINKYYLSIRPTVSTSSMIIDPMFTAHEECSADRTNTIFGI